MNHRFSKAVRLVSAVAFLLGCASGDPVSIGEDEPAKTGEKLSDFAAHWDGYVELFHFASGSDQVRITLDESGQGTITFGEGTPPPSPTDPNVGWPHSPGPIVDAPIPIVGALIEGFAFSTLDARVTNRRLELSYNSREQYGDWCQLQTETWPWNSESVGQEGADYRCVPNASSERRYDGNTCIVSVDGLDSPMDCTKYTLCDRAFCTCDADSCAAGDERIALDGALDETGNTLVGATTFGEQRYTVRLERQ